MATLKTPSAYAFDFKLRLDSTLYMMAILSVDSLVEFLSRSYVKIPRDPGAVLAILENSASPDLHGGNSGGQRFDAAPSFHVRSIDRIDFNRSAVSDGKYFK